MRAMISTLLLAILAGAYASNGLEDRKYHAVSSAANLKLMAETNNVHGSNDSSERTIEFWNNKSLNIIKEHLAVKQRNNVAKNVIMFLGDGMSVATVTAARIYLGQLNNMTGEEYQLSWEKFPYTGLSKTYCVNSQVADSACSATAYLNGVKGNIHTIGVTADVALNDWVAMKNESYHTSSIAKWAQDAGKGAGIVTTCRVTDASPTGTYAHTAYRYWESDTDLLKDVPEATGVQDIATQLVKNDPGKYFKVIMGGGRMMFLPNTTDDGYGNKGHRGDGVDLVNEWSSTHMAAGYNSSYITNREQLLSLDISKTDYLMGLFTTSHMAYNLHANQSLQPTLAEMAKVAIQMMQKEPNGYFLFIEGGQIDHGHHAGKAHLALDEAVEFHKAIEVAVELTSEDDTLIVVTADHAHTLSISGYPARGSDIFNTLQNTEESPALSYSTLSYANGPNPVKFDVTTGIEHDIAADNRSDADYVFPSSFKLGSETHDGQDVGVWARGPRAHLLVGNYEQTVIAHVMGYAAKVGPAAALDTTPDTAATTTTTTTTTTTAPTTSSSDARSLTAMALWILLASVACARLAIL